MTQVSKSDIKLNFNVAMAGIQTNLFYQEQAGPQKPNDLGPSPKLMGPGFGGNHFITTTKHLLYSYLKLKTLKICIPLIIYHITVLGIN